MIDLHAHTSASDGSLSFSELVTEAKRVGLRALAITDHDTVRCASMIRPGASVPLLIPGAELTVFDEGLGYKDIHILGLFLDTSDAALNSRLSLLESDRLAQKRATVARLRELGYDLDFEEVRREASGAVGRPHIAKALLRKYPGEFKSVSEVFQKLLARGKEGYVEREAGFSLRESVDLIHGAGGLAFVAHPLLYPYDSVKLLEDFRSLGGDGVEVYYDYIKNRPEERISAAENTRIIERYQGLARDLGLLESGGSDFHGAAKGQALGVFGAPDQVLDRLTAALRKPL
ncbi:MAG: PHP domain-containing protein [Candidatus Micrarchaeia archaeon]